MRRRLRRWLGIDPDPQETELFNHVIAEPKRCPKCGGQWSGMDGITPCGMCQIKPLIEWHTYTIEMVKGEGIKIWLDGELVHEADQHYVPKSPSMVLWPTGGRSSVYDSELGKWVDLDWPMPDVHFHPTPTEE